MNGNQLTKDEVVKRNGNTVSTKSTQFWYDGYNQLQRVQDVNGMYTEYTYNGSGLRTKKESGDKATNYIYDGSANIIMETDENNMPTAKNIRGLGLIYRETDLSAVDLTFIYYLHNAHGDITKLVDEKGQLIKDYQYDTFGQEKIIPSQAFGGNQGIEMWRQEIETIDNPFRYCGEYQDQESGNYYLRARYYDPVIQRFTQEDSFGVEKGAAWQEHLYGYANNNPVMYNDPSGHFFNFISSAVGAVIGGLFNTAATAISDFVDDGHFNMGWREYAGSFASGAITGAAAGFTGGASLAVEVGAGAAFAATGNMAGQLISNGNLDFSQTGWAAVGGGVGYGVGNVAGKWLGSAAQAGEATLAKGLGSAMESNTVATEMSLVKPSQLASSWQQNVAGYGGIDEWVDVGIMKGSTVWGGAPGQSAFYTTNEVMAEVGTNATTLFNGLQVGKGAYPLFRPGMTQYEVLENIPAAYSTALANTQYGGGGFSQYFIPNYESVLKPIKSIILTNR